MPINLETLAAEVAELRAIVRKPRKPKDRRVAINLRVTTEELAAIDAASRDHGVNRSDLLRIALNPVLQLVLPIKRKIPPGFRRLHAHHKPDRFDDGQTDHARIHQALAHRTELIDANAATVARTEHVEQGMLAQPRPTKFPR